MRRSRGGLISKIHAVSVGNLIRVALVRLDRAMLLPYESRVIG